MRRFALYRAPLLTAVAVAIGACDDARQPLAPGSETEPGVAELAKAKVVKTRLAFSIFSGSSSTLYSMKLDGSDYKVVPNTVGGSDPAWSPDRKKIAYTVPVSADSGLYVISPSGSGRKRVYPGAAWAASWSPDGSRIAFYAHSAGGSLAVMAIQPGGAGLAVLTPADGGSYSNPTWSPDGGRIAYLKYNSFGSEIWVMNADGSSPRRVIDCATLAVTCSSPTWSPAAGDERIAFSVRDGDNRALVTIESDGTDWRNVIYGPEYQSYDLRPSWSPDGTELAFTSFQTGNGEIFLVRDDGTNLRQVTFTPEYESFPAWSR